MVHRDECSHVRSACRISSNVEVKIVDSVTGEPLSVGQKGELRVRGPSIMTGYVGDDEANVAAFDSDGWLKTGDLCYIDQDGFVFVGYGSTESGCISLMINWDECSHIGSAGRVSHDVEVKIVDMVTGEPLSDRQKGELRVRGRSIMTGYVGDDEANAAALGSEGWLNTVDLCYIDQEGFVFVVDRLKELIKYPHEEAGQIPMALVMRQPESKVTEAQVMEHVAKQVAPYKKIRKVVFVDSNPKSPAGKILRRQLSSYLQSCQAARL
ncbi:hypothetical protein ACQ4PT_017902 [Festuca glaucescens]